MLWKDSLEGGGWQQNLRSPHRLCISLAAVLLVHQHCQEELSLLPWNTFCGYVEPLERFSTLCAFLIRFSLRLGFKFVWALTRSGLPLKALNLCQVAQEFRLAWPAWHRHGEGCALCVSFLTLVRLLKLIYWAAHLFQNSHERDTLWGLHLLRDQRISAPNKHHS